MSKAWPTAKCGIAGPRTGVAKMAIGKRLGDGVVDGALVRVVVAMAVGEEMGVSVAQDVISKRKIRANTIFGNAWAVALVI
jgi:hypothetical protein